MSGEVWNEITDAFQNFNGEKNLGRSVSFLVPDGISQHWTNKHATLCQNLAVIGPVRTASTHHRHGSGRSQHVEYVNTMPKTCFYFLFLLSWLCMPWKWPKLFLCFTVVHTPQKKDFSIWYNHSQLTMGGLGSKLGSLFLMSDKKWSDTPDKFQNCSITDGNYS